MKPLAREILRFLFQHPTTEFAYRNLERRTGLSIATVGRYVRELQAAGLVRSRRAAHAIFVRGSGNERFLHLKRAFNLESVYTSGLAEALAEALRPEALVLFGSYARGEDQESSDIDVAVVRGREGAPDLARYERLLGRKVSLTRVPDAKKAPREFRNTLANGILLAGYLEVA